MKTLQLFKIYAVQNMQNIFAEPQRFLFLVAVFIAIGVGLFCGLAKVR